MTGIIRVVAENDYDGRMEMIREQMQGKIHYHFEEGKGFVVTPSQRKILGWQNYLDWHRRHNNGHANS